MSENQSKSDTSDIDSDSDKEQFITCGKYIPPGQNAKNMNIKIKFLKQHPIQPRRPSAQKFLTFK